MKILVLNSGSSSVKYQLIEMDDEQVICKGIVERIGNDDAIVQYHATGQAEKRDTRPVPDHTEAINAVLSLLMVPETGVIQDKSEIAAVGHRTVHGGESFAGSVRIDDRVIQIIKECAVFAPLHNPHNLKGIQVCMQLLPDTPQVAVFDTAFHQTMLPSAYLYALPYPLYEKLKVRRYGFHGTSHRYVAHKAAETLGRPIGDLKIITLHLGNGASATAIQYGKSVDTSMGFTPLEGLVMGTRSGDIDPALVLHIMSVEALAPEEMDRLLNEKSGLLGLTEFSQDMREIEDRITKGDARASLALDIYCRRIRKYIGAYAAIMGGVDAIVFTGGVGENAARVREWVCQDLDFLGVTYDREANLRLTAGTGNKAPSPHISTGPTKVLVIPTNEELVIARDTKEVLFERNS